MTPTDPETATEQADGHTPGPWVAEGDFVVHEGARPDDPDTPVIADLYATNPYPRDERKANARLIAAAPDLLEALKALKATHTEQVNAHDETWRDQEAALKVDDAIAKAEGRDD